MNRRIREKTKRTYRKSLVSVVLICICLICSGCAVGGSPVPSFEEQIASIMIRC